MKGDVVFAAAAQDIDGGKNNEELNPAGAASVSRVEALGKTFDVHASRADEEAVAGDVAGIAQDKARLQTEEGKMVHEVALAAKHRPSAPAGGGDMPVVAMPPSPVEDARQNKQPDALEREEGAPDGGGTAVADAFAAGDAAEPSLVGDQLPEVQLPEVERVEQAPIDIGVEVSVATSLQM